jgi:hypothetical protein
MGRRGMAMLATAWRASSSMVGEGGGLEGWRVSLLAAGYGVCVCVRKREKERVKKIGFVLVEG